MAKTYKHKPHMELDTKESGEVFKNRIYAKTSDFNPFSCDCIYTEMCLCIYYILIWVQLAVFSSAVIKTDA